MGNANDKNKAASPLTAGVQAPDFELENQSGARIRLSDLKGEKVVLYFYPKAMTPGCSVQARGMRDTKKQLAQAGLRVFGISPDSVTRLKKFYDKESLNFDLLSDEDHQVAERYGVWGLKKFMGREYLGVLRVTFLIDEQGCISRVLDQVKTKSHHQDVLAEEAS